MKKKSIRKKTKKSKKNSFAFYKYTIFALLIIIIALSAFIAGYIINDKKNQKEIKTYKNTLATLQYKIEKLSNEINKYKTQKTILSKHIYTKTSNSEIIDYLEALKKQKTKPTLKETTSINKKIYTNKPKLVLIIDDVAFGHEVKMIKSIPYKITPSFFPPTKRHPNTPFYAKEFKDYMVHVPMEAINFAHPEPNTLLTSDNYVTIKTKLDLIKKEFPKVKFINNHTGSKFTSNLQSMNYLFIALKSDNLGFVDSKTTPYSKALVVDKIHKIPLYCRDIFLDNVQNPNYIRNQLKKAIKLAKKRGYAIAIGHPHKITLETIKNSKDLLKQVDVITIDELGKYAKN